MFLLFTHISYGGQLREGLIQLLIVCSGDIEVNLRPKTKSQISFCHWNLNGLSAHHFVKVSNDDVRMRIEGYNPLRADHPSNKKRGGVCMYYKEHLPIIKRDDLCSLKECLVKEIIVGKKKLFFCVYIDHQAKLKNLRSFVLI